MTLERLSYGQVRIVEAKASMLSCMRAVVLIPISIYSREIGGCFFVSLVMEIRCHRFGDESSEKSPNR